MEECSLKLQLEPRDHTPLYLQIERQIKSLISRQDLLRPDAKLPAVHKLAQQLGVSVTTAQKALGDLIKEGFLYTRHGCGTYVAPPGATRVRRIAVTCYGLEKGVPLTLEHAPTFLNLMSGLSECVLDKGFHTYLLARSGDVLAADDIDGLGLSGVVFLSHVPSLELVRTLKGRGFPYVCVGNEPFWKEENLNRVTSHAATATRELLEALFLRTGEAGYVRVETKAPVSQPRSQVIYGEMRQARGQPPGANVLRVKDDRGSESEVLAWLKRTEGLRSLFVDDYPFAIRLCHLLVTHGRRVPDDVSIGSVAERHNLVSGVPIAVAVRDSVALGRIAGERMISLIEGQEQGPLEVDLRPCVHWP